MSKAGLIVAAIFSLSMLAVSVYVWLSLGAAETTATGYLGVIAGGLAMLGLGVGLMALIFYSHAKGFDDRAGARPPPGERPTP
jgi:hypothetical protein